MSDSELLYQTLYYLSHELRKPLRAIHGFSQVIIEDYHELYNIDKEFKRYLDIICNSSINAGEMIDGIMTGLLGKTGKLNKDKSIVPESITLIIEKIVNGFTDTPKVLFKVLGFTQLVVNSPTEITIVLNNLIRNSIEAMPNGGEITIELGFDAENDFYNIFVADNGMGIDSKLITHILNELFVSSRKKDGLGLGLWIAKSCMTGIGGDLVLVRSDKTGTVFKVSIPKNKVVSK